MKTYLLVSAGLLVLVFMGMAETSSNNFVEQRSTELVQQLEALPTELIPSSRERVPTQPVAGWIHRIPEATIEDTGPLAVNTLHLSSKSRADAIELNRFDTRDSFPISVVENPKVLADALELWRVASTGAIGGVVEWEGTLYSIHGWPNGLGYVKSVTLTRMAKKEK